MMILSVIFINRRASNGDYDYTLGLKTPDVRGKAILHIHSLDPAPELAYHRKEMDPTQMGR
jgi:hypothetical protein